MFDTVAPIYFLGLLMSVAGFVLILLSLFSRAHRGVKSTNRFWAPAESFAPGEYAQNRVGFVLVVAGVLFSAGSVAAAAF